MEKYNDRNLIQKGYAVKVGTSSLVDQTESGYQVNHTAFNNIARQMAVLNRQGLNAFLVSSGAIALGKVRDNVLAKELDNSTRIFEEYRRDLVQKGIAQYQRSDEERVKHQELAVQVIKYKRLAAGLGQHTLMTYWDDYFGRYGSLVDQVLYRGDMGNTFNYIQDSYEWGRIPIINGDDTTNTFTGENNDDLACRFAWVGALNLDLLIFITKAPGVLDRKNQVIPFYGIDERKKYQILPDGLKLSVDRADISKGFLRRVGKYGETSLGKGGIRYKIEQAGHFAASTGVGVITNVDYKDVILRTVQGERLGTWFYGRKRLIKEGRERWLSVIDHGQARRTND